MATMELRQLQDPLKVEGELLPGEGSAQRPRNALPRRRASCAIQKRARATRKGTACGRSSSGTGTDVLRGLGLAALAGIIYIRKKAAAVGDRRSCRICDSAYLALRPHRLLPCGLLLWNNMLVPARGFVSKGQSGVAASLTAA